MTDKVTPEIPEGFETRTLGPYSTLIGPLMYRNRTDEQGRPCCDVGLVLEDRHIGGNNRGHGGLMLTLLDETMGMTAFLQRGNAPTVTVSLSSHFIGALVPGQFVYARAKIIQITSTLAFIDGEAFSGDKRVGTASGVWKYLHSARLQRQARPSE